MTAGPRGDYVSILRIVHMRHERKSRAELAKNGPGDAQTCDPDHQPSTTVRAAGNPANSRYRVTFVARQLVHDYYSSGKDPTGHICNSV